MVRVIMYNMEFSNAKIIAKQYLRAWTINQTKIDNFSLEYIQPS